MTRSFMLLSIVSFFSAAAIANPMECFEREWYFTRASDSATSMNQVAQVVQQSSILEIISADSRILTVAYKPQLGSNVLKDRQELSSLFDRITSMGLIVGCNQLLTPMGFAGPRVR
jgi:hypothetical protein